MPTLSEVLTLLPKPAVSCLVIAITNSTCELGDTACTCANPTLQAQATACVAANCTIREALYTKNLTSSLCGVEPEVDYSFVPIFIAFVVIAGIAVILRLAARFIKSANIWWDDICNIGALALCVAFTGVAFYIKDIGFGVDIWGVEPENITKILTGYYIEFALYGVARLLVRVSIVLFYLRIFQMTKARPIMIGTLIAMCCLSISFIMATMFQCTPVSYFWNKWDGEHEGHCINVNAMVWASSICAIIFDFWLFFVPVPFILQLQLSWRKKLLISVMLVTGIVVIVISILRVPSINEFTKTHNVTKDFVGIGIWSALEMNVGVLCACMPSIHVLFKALFPKQWSTTRGDSGRLVSNSRGKASNGSGGRGPFSRITMTTTIEQGNPTESQTHLPLEYNQARRNELELGAMKKESVQSYAWS
ncbi:unnamed protein product [Clonostachys rosea]|uniref:CFEM domain-containing protein n=1 Tax=Bionectria ochroleuca TaxID=29856 RepID=A0ABY6U4E1_BIOOC|nr:unnamed protein product [Clonostachys rosea]